MCYACPQIDSRDNVKFCEARTVWELGHDIQAIYDMLEA